MGCETEHFLGCISGMTPLQLALWNHGQIDPQTRKVIDCRKTVQSLLDGGAKPEIPVNYDYNSS